MLDFSTLYNKDFFHQMIKEALVIDYLDIIERPNSQRDAKEIVLYNEASFEFIDLVSPIIYFVDTFVSLFNNKLWFQMRNIKYDIVVDRHGNFMPLYLIAEQRC